MRTTIQSSAMEYMCIIWVHDVLRKAMLLARVFLFLHFQWVLSDLRRGLCVVSFYGTTILWEERVFLVAPCTLYNIRELLLENQAVTSMSFRTFLWLSIFRFKVLFLWEKAILRLVKVWLHSTRYDEQFHAGLTRKSYGGKKTRNRLLFWYFNAQLNCPYTVSSYNSHWVL